VRIFSAFYVDSGDVQRNGLDPGFCPWVTRGFPGAGAQLPVPVDGGGVQWHGLGP
jgi:hypothetical protein